MSTTSYYYKKALSQHGMAQVIIDINVLDKYLEDDKYSVIRTNSVGRVRASTWNFDFGIAPDETKIHVMLSDFTDRLPDREKEHWLEHISSDKFSENFLKMRNGGACIDDGGLRQWGEAESLI